MTPLNDKLLAVPVPEKYKNFTIQKFTRAGYWLMETDSTELNHVPPV